MMNAVMAIQLLCEPLLSYQKQLCKPCKAAMIRDKRRFYITVIATAICLLAAVSTAVLIVYSNLLYYPTLELRTVISTKEIVETSHKLQQAAQDPSSLNVIHSSNPILANTRHAYSLLIIVDSDPDAKGARMAARCTWMEWAKSFGDDVLIRFAIAAGNSEISARDLSSLLEENRLHGDMLLFRDMASLPESEVALFEMLWAEYNVKYYYLMKTRDSFYLHLTKILEDIEQLKRDNSNVYWGYFEGHKNPQTDDRKHKEPNWFLCDTYIRFAHSGAYVLSRNLVKRLVSQISLLHPYVNEDVAMGTWLSPYNDIDWKHDVRFDSEIGHSRGCSNSFLVFQSSRELDLKTLHEHIVLGEKLCTFEHVSITHDYDFNALPLHCCRTISM